MKLYLDDFDPKKTSMRPAARWWICIGCIAALAGYDVPVVGAQESPYKTSNTSTTAIPDGQTSASNPFSDRHDSLNAAAAKEAYAQGRSYMHEGLHAIALEYFEKSQRLDPHPLTTLMMAFIESGVGRNAHARILLLQTLSDVARLDAEQRSTAEQLYKSVNANLGRVRVTLVNAPAFVAIDGRPVDRDQAPDPQNPKRAVWTAGRTIKTQIAQFPMGTMDILVDPGFHSLQFTADGYYQEYRQHAVDVGETISVEVSFTRRRWRRAGIGLAVAGSVGLATGFGTFLAAVNKRDDAKTQCSATWVCSIDGRKDYKRAQLFAQIGTYTIPLSAVVGTVGATIWVATNREHDEVDSRQYAINLQPIIGHHESMLLFSGSF